jgi:hypothetical protein
MLNTRSQTSVLIACSILFYLFFQLISDFVTAIYAIGLLSLSLTVEVAFVLVLLSPIILIFFRNPPPGRSRSR